MNCNEIKEALWNPAFQNQNTDVILAQYKLYIEMIDNVSERREKSNNFFLILNGAIITTMASLIGKYPNFFGKWQLLLLLIVLIGELYYWKQIIKSYEKLNQAKFQVVEELEEKLPARPYVKAEWKCVLKEGKEKNIYWPLTHVEGKIPWFFALLYVGLFITQTVNLCKF